MRLLKAKLIVQSLLCHLWDCGLARKWVLHNCELYVPRYDIKDRHKDEDDPQRHTILRGESDGLYYYGDSGRPLPDFDSIAYWEKKKAELERKIEEVQARKVKHKFRSGELRRTRLLEQDEALSLGSSGSPKTNGISAWLNGANDAEPRPPSPPRSRSASIVSSNHAGWGFSSRATKGVDSKQAQVRNPGANKRKRPTNNDKELLPGHSSKPSRGQPPPDPKSIQPAPSLTSRYKTPTSLQDHSPQRAATSALPPLGPPNIKRTTGHLLGDRSSQRSTTRGATREENAVKERQVPRQIATGPRTGGQRKKRGGPTENSPPELRRSERLAVLPRRDYTWRGLCR